MSLTNARIFVASLKENGDFRSRALTTSNTEELVEFLRSEKLIFTQRDLVVAMTECMEQQEMRNETTN